MSVMPPRVAFTYWHQGFADAPPVIRACVAQLRCQNPKWQIHALDEESVQDIVETIPISSEKFSCLSLAHRSDLIRTRLLIDHGGVWIDPTVFVTQPFDSWLQSKMPAGFFLFSRPGRDRLISNWFMSAQPKHPIFVELYKSLCAYWENNSFRNHGRKLNYWEELLARGINRNLVFPRAWFSWPFTKLFRVYPYMVYHYLFFHLISGNADLKAIYSEMPKVPAGGPCALQRLGIGNRFDLHAEKILSDRNVPLHKLTWKTCDSATQSGSILDFLVQASAK